MAEGLRRLEVVAVRKTSLIGAAVALAMVGVLVLPGAAGAQAPEAAATCQLIGIVHLDTETSLINAANGAGNFTAASGIVCEGLVAGVGNLSGGGAFSFCEHNSGNTGPAACHGDATAVNTGAGTPADFTDDENASLGGTDLEGAYDTINDGPAPVVADFKGSATFGPFTPGSGHTCDLNFIGHATAAAVEIVVRNFNCSGGIVTVPAMTGAATAVPAFVLKDCSATAEPDPICFGGGAATDPSVVFAGAIAVHSL